MKHDRLAKLLKIIIVGTTLLGIFAAAYFIPDHAKTFKEMYPEFSHWLLPWLILLYTCAVPCFVAMGISWKIATNIGHDKGFTMENAKLFKVYSILALADTIVFLDGSIVFMFCGINHPGILLISLFIAFVGFAIYVCTAGLSYLVEKAATLQEDSDLTI